MASLRVLPRDTPGERAETVVDVDVSEELALLANHLEEWVAPLGHWDVTFRQGHEFDRPGNVEARLLFTGGEHACSLTFRLDQVDGVRELDGEVWLTIDERNGIATSAHLAPLGFDVATHHIVGAALGRAGG